MDPATLRRLWEDAGGDAASPPAGPGLFGLPIGDEPGALTGAALVALGLPLGEGALTPSAVRVASAKYAGWFAGPSLPLRSADYGDVEAVPDDMAVTFMCAHERLADIVAAGAAPLVLGGDAVVSLPVLQVLSGKLHGRLGIVAFTPSYDIAPEPLYAGASRWARALELGVVAPTNLVLIGGRAAPPDGPARRLLDALGVSTCSVADVARDGIATAAQEAVETAAAGTEAVYLSVDVGVVAGLGDPVGLSARELAAGVAVAATALLAAADVCGSGPEMHGGRAAAVAARVAAEVAAGVAGRLA